MNSWLLSSTDRSTIAHANKARLDPFRGVTQVSPTAEMAASLGGSRATSWQSNGVAHGVRRLVSPTQAGKAVHIHNAGDFLLALDDADTDGITAQFTTRDGETLTLEQARALKDTICNAIACERPANRVNWVEEITEA